MLLLTHVPKPISLARQRRDSLEVSYSENSGSGEYSFSDPCNIPEGSVIVDLGTTDVLENCMILLDYYLDVGVDEFRHFRDKLIEGGLNRDTLPEKYLL